MEYITGTEQENTGPRYGQVYLATHGGDGLRLPSMNRSFISFQYGGKYIEDFNLIATISGDRYERNGYAEFNDLVSSYDNLDGQYYWGTHFKNNQMDFTLSTDEIDQKMLDDFLHWFRPGVCRELILAEHPNRGILARVMAPPKISMLPFGKDITVPIGDDTFNTKTTIYKGDIQLSLVMDEPHWYGIKGVFVGNDIASSNDATDGIRAENYKKDLLKMVYEDDIPYAEKNINNKIVTDMIEIPVPQAGDKNIIQIMLSNGLVATRGMANVLIKDQADANLKLSHDYTDDVSRVIYFFYSGTAPAHTILTFTMTPILSSRTNQPPYIICPKNTYSDTNTNDEYNVPHSIITIRGRNEFQFWFTTPNVYTSYNKALDIMNKMINNGDYTVEDIVATLRDQVFHKAAREWAVKIMNTQTVNNGIDKSAVFDEMKEFLLNDDEENKVVNPVTFEFNSELGKATGDFTYRNNQENLVTVREDVGDMVRSNYIIIQDKDYFTSDGTIKYYSDTNLTRQMNSHVLYHNMDGVVISNLQFKYKNMYL